MEPNYIFGLTKRLIKRVDSIRSGWVIDTGGRDNRVKMGTPCLVLKAPLEPVDPNPRGRSEQKIILLPFSADARQPNRLVLDTHNNANSLTLSVGEETDFFDNVNELNIGQFNFNKLVKGSSSVRDGGPITFLVSKSASGSLRQDIKEMLGHFFGKYKYAFNTQYAQNGKKSLLQGDKCLLAVTFMDIGQCIPIFDPSKVDGILININVIYTEHCVYKDRLVTSSEMTFYFSNHAANLLNVDGQDMHREICAVDHMKAVVDSMDEYLNHVGETRAAKKAKKTVNKELGVEERMTLKKSKPAPVGYKSVKYEPSPSAYNTSSYSGTTSATGNWYTNS